MATFENFASSGTWTASSSHASYPAARLGDEKYIYTYNAATTWLSNTGTTTNVTLDCNFGSAKTFRYVEVIKVCQNYKTISIQDYEIYVSSDGVSWGSAVKSGSLTEPTGCNYQESEIIDIGSNQTYQYCRLKALNNWGHANYVGANEIMIYADNVNLSADGTTNIVTNSYTGARVDDNLENSVFGTTASTDAWFNGVTHFTWITIDWDFGSQKYVDYIVFFLWRAGGFEPKDYQLFVSSDGVDWGEDFATGTLAENANAYGEVRQIDFSSTPRYTQYLRVAFVDSWSAATYGAIFHMARCYETSTPANPSAPDKPVAEGCGTQDIYITWTYSEPADFDYYEVWRSADGGGYVKASTDEQVKEKYFLDTNPTGTNFTYQIKAVTKVPTTSAASTASDSTTKGAAGGETSHTFS